MPAIDFKALSRLPPEERVRVLQRLEDQLQRIIKQRAEEIQQSRREIAEAESLLERAKEELVVLEKIATPEARAVRIDDLFFQKPAGQKEGRGREGQLEKAERPDEAVQRRQEQERREQERASLESVASTYQRPEAERPFNPQNEAYRNAIGPQEMQRPEEQKPYKKREERRTGAEGVYKRKDED